MNTPINNAVRRSAQISRNELLIIIKQNGKLSQIWRNLAQEDISDAAHDLEHLLRVSCWTYNIISAEALNDVDDILIQGIAAALLHDVVNVPKNHSDRNQASTRSSHIAATLFKQVGFDTDQCNTMSTAIKTHSLSLGAVPSSLLGCALQDADRLDALGAVGIFRCFAVSAQIGAKLVNSDDPWAHDRLPDDYAFAVDHFLVKLLSLHTTMTTDTGRNEAARRTSVLKRYLADLGQEIGVAYADSSEKKGLVGITTI